MTGFRWDGRLPVLGLMIGVLGVSGCGRSASTATPVPVAPVGTRPTPAPALAGDRLGAIAVEPARLSKQAEPSPFRFAEIAKEAGIDFVHFSGMTEEKHFPTANGSGAAIFDYDNDGKLDVYFATATLLPLGTAQKGPNRLYKNLGDNKFQDVTEASGLGFRGYCHGIVVGDIDNDGDQDVVLCNYGPNVLYLNNGDGTFTDISKSSGIGRPALKGSITGEGDAAAAGPLIVDFVSGPAWKVGGQTGTKVALKAGKGRRVVFRQADPDAAHGVKFRDADVVVKANEAETPRAVLREVAAGPSRIGQVAPPLAKGAEPVVIAEFEVVQEIKGPISFSCAVYDRAWSSGGAFLDYDNDGDLDLYLTNYGEWDYPEDGKAYCGDQARQVRLYCSPREIRTVKHFLYRNNGDHTFTDVYDSAITVLDPDTKQRKPNPRSDGHGFGVVASDLNGDGKIDLYVANDMNPNFLFLNLGDGTFDDATEASGAAFDEKGQAQSGMGVDAEDVNGDGLPELFVTNFAQEYNTLYQNLGRGSFMDVTPYFGLAADTMPWVGWGTALIDLDNDGWPDNFVANGHVDDNRRKLVPPQPVDYEEPPLLFRNLDGKRFKLSTRDAGPYFDAKHVGRGAAFGDIDNDGDIDIVVNHKGGPPALLRNDTPTANHWLRLDLQGTVSNRDAVGARVEATVGGRTLFRQRKGGASMESAHDPRLLIGVGPAEEVDTLIVRWPSGAVTTREHVPTSQTLKLVEPTAKPDK